MENPYPLPNDEEEIKRLDRLQDMFRSLKPNITARIPENPTQFRKSILFGLRLVDVGTGSGAWAIEVGYQYPDVRVCGIDLSPVRSEMVPENVEFVVMDVTHGLQFNEESTDLVHSR